MNLTTRATMLRAIDPSDGDAVGCYLGRAQTEITDHQLGDVDAVRINGVLYTPCTDSELQRNLDFEWETQSPALDVRGDQEAALAAKMGDRLFVIP